MKVIKIFLLLCLFYAGNVCAQNANDVADPECFGMTKRGDISYNYVYFNLHGVNLTKYDWSDPTTNCNINLATLYNKKRTTNSYLGAAALGVGLALITTGIGQSYYGEGGGLIATGVLASGGGVALYIFGSKFKKKANYRMGEVIDYYSKNNSLSFKD